VFDTRLEDRVKVKLNGYCTKCHHTYWSGEVVAKGNKGFEHMDCLVALADKSPRKINPKMEYLFSGISKAKLKKKAKKKLLASGFTSPEG
jgi:hypothetical protein